MISGDVIVTKQLLFKILQLKFLVVVLNRLKFCQGVDDKSRCKRTEQDFAGLEYT